MTRLQELEREASTLTERERAELAAHLLSSLPAVAGDSDDGVAEALRREAEMNTVEDPGIGWDELKRGLGR